MRAGAHEDINLITLLLGAEEAGLELLDRDSGRWLAVKPPEGAMVVNVGDMLQRLTNHVLPSTTHRVVNPPPERRGHSRYSMPFFLHFRPDFMIEALPGTVPAGEEPKWPPISSHDYLLERLREREAGGADACAELEHGAWLVCAMERARRVKHERRVAVDVPAEQEGGFPGR